MQLSFDELDQAIKIEQEIQLETHRNYFSELVRCHFCGEQMPRGWMPNNHGIVFNGWCMKALAYAIRNHGRQWTEEAAWLERKGIPFDADRFDERFWHRENVGMHYDKHFSSCYRGECA
jgi:hypothetical protein